MAEAIIRRGARRGYTTVLRTVAQDGRLSLKALGLYVRMQSYPDDWRFTIAGLASVSGCGRDQIRAALAELEAVGYLVKAQAHDEGGKFSGAVYVLQEEAPPLSGFPTTVRRKNEPLSEKPSTEKPTTEKPSTENPTLIDKYIKQNHKKTKPPISPRTPGEVWDCVFSFLGDDPEYIAAFEGFLANRVALKKPVLTTRSINAIINRLRPVSRETGIAMLDRATESNWLTVYPLRADDRPAAPDDGRRGRCL